MKVYESSTTKHFNKTPEIKIKNKRLIKSGFSIGKEFAVTYDKNKIILEIIQDKIIK